VYLIFDKEKNNIFLLFLKKKLKNFGIYKKLRTFATANQKSQF